MRVTHNPHEATDVDLIGRALHPDRFEPVRTLYGGDPVPRRRRRTHADVLGDLLGGAGHRRNGDGSFMPAGGGISARRLG